MLELERYYDPHFPDPSNRPEEFEWREIMVRMTDCRNRRQCGIMQPTSSGSWRIDWDSCPAAVAFKEQP